MKNAVAVESADWFAGAPKRLGEVDGLLTLMRGPRRPRARSRRAFPGIRPSVAGLLMRPAVPLS